MTRSYDHEKVDQLLKSAKSIDDITGKGGILQEMLKKTINELLKVELQDHLGYSHGDRSSKKTENCRNGSSSKTLKTGSGDIEINVPRDRDGTYDPKLVEKNQTSTSDFEDKIISMYAKGMTTRDISKHFNDLYGTDISPTLVSNATNKVKELSKQWQTRPLEEFYPCLFLDVIHYKVRQDGQIQTKAAYVCLAINADGIREILGIYIGNAESSKFWLSVLTDLNNRGIKDILIACIDGLKGFPEAIEAIFPMTEIQLCVIHQIRNSLKYIASKDQKEFMKDLKPVYKARTLEEAETNLEALEVKWGTKYGLVIKSWKTKWPLLSAYFQYSEPIRKMIYTTNIIESYHRALRKVTKNRSIFPSDESLQKMVYLATVDISKKWTSPRHNWGQTISQLSIFFEGRVPISL